MIDLDGQDSAAAKAEDAKKNGGIHIEFRLWNVLLLSPGLEAFSSW